MLVVVIQRDLRARRRLLACDQAPAIELLDVATKFSNHTRSDRKRCVSAPPEIVEARGVDRGAARCRCQSPHPLKTGAG